MVRIDKLNIIDGKAYFGDKLFNGVGIEINGAYVINKYDYSDGIRVKENSSWVQNSELKILKSAVNYIDESELEDEEIIPGAYFQGKPFVGLMFEFYPSGLLKSEEYTDGEDTYGMEWYDTGQKRLFIDKDYSTTEWDKDGGILNVTRGDFSISFKNKKLQSLILWKEADLSEYKFVADEMLNLVGGGVNDESILQIESLENVRKLILSKTKLTSKSLSYFNQQALEYLDTSSNIELSDKDIRQFINEHCDWLNRDEFAN